MLISFEVENFRSIKTKQTLSMERAGHGFESRLDVDSEPACGTMTPVAVIFGANASGKSNIIDALFTLQKLVAESADNGVGRPLPEQPFRFDQQCLDKPTSFLIHFTTQHHEYEYSLSLLHGIVISEHLYESVNNRTRRSKRTLFTRLKTDSKNKPAIKISPRLSGSKKTIIDATRDNMLFLSKAAKENFTPLMDPYHWFVPADSSQNPLDLFESDEEFRNWSLLLMGNADLGISDIQIKASNVRPPENLVKAVTGSSDSASLARAEQALIASTRTLSLTHRSVSNNKIVEDELPWRYESAGTQQLWNYSGSIYTALRDGTLLLVDEIQNLHPLLLREIITTFQQKHTNPRGAQLLFTSHDTVLLGNWAGMGFILDRDQIWFTEKGIDGATQLYSLIDFSPRETDNVEKMYLQGRLGAVPALGPLTR